LDEFKAAQPKLQQALRDILGPKGRWIYQLEKTDRKVDSLIYCNSSRCAAAGRGECDDCLTWHIAANPVPPVDNWHYQIYMYTNEKTRPATIGQRFQQHEEYKFKGFRAGIASSAGLIALEKYSMKKNTRMAGPWADKKIREEYVYDGKKEEELWPWQKHVVDLVREKPDDRHINWVCNTEGCSGKTQLAKFMSHDEKCDGVGLKNGHANDLNNLIYKNQGRNCYMFDLPRTKPGSFHSSDVYSIIESLKDGRLINTKFETHIIEMKPPHVWVFANHLPDKYALTHDRLIIWQVDGFGAGATLGAFDYKKHAEYEKKQKIEKKFNQMNEPYLQMLGVCRRG